MHKSNSTSRPPEENHINSSLSPKERIAEKNEVLNCSEEGVMLCEGTSLHGNITQDCENEGALSHLKKDDEIEQNHTTLRPKTQTNVELTEDRKHLAKDISKNLWKIIRIEVLSKVVVHSICLCASLVNFSVATNLHYFLLKKLLNPKELELILGPPPAIFPPKFLLKELLWSKEMIEILGTQSTASEHLLLEKLLQSKEVMQILDTRPLPLHDLLIRKLLQSEEITQILTAHYDDMLASQVSSASLLKTIITTDEDIAILEISFCSSSDSTSTKAASAKSEVNPLPHPASILEDVEICSLPREVKLNANRPT